MRQQLPDYSPNKINQTSFQSFRNQKMNNHEHSKINSSINDSENIINNST